jgi:hypothetical protein
MFNILIPVIIALVYLLYLKMEKPKNKVIKKEHFQNIIPLEQDKKPIFSIELVEINPMFSQEKFIIKDVVNPDGTIENGVLTKVENVDWKEDFTRKLCLGCSCSNPKVYTKYRYKREQEKKSEATLSDSNITPSPGPSPGPSPTISPGPSPGPSPTISPGPSPGPSPSITPGPSPGPSPTISPGPSPSISPGLTPSDTEKYDPLLPLRELEEYTELVQEERKNCGYTFEGNEYQCAQVCSQCNLCDNDNNSSIEFNDKCDVPKEAEDKELCKFFRDRVKFVKESCIFPSKLKNVIVNDRECFSFYNKKYNRYYVNDKVIFRLKTNKKVDLIDIYQIFYRNNKNRKINATPIIFYTDTNEAYFYINTKNLESFEGDIKLFFVVNITYLGEKQRYDENINIEVIRKLDYIKMYENILPSEKQVVDPNETLPADFDLYNLNYLEESELNPKQIVDGYSVKNEVKNYQIGEFKRLDYKDNPDTWELRPDINRPWISVG